MKDDIKTIARKISDLEDDISNGINIENSIKEIQRLSTNLTIEEMESIDQYLMGEKFEFISKF